MVERHGNSAESEPKMEGQNLLNSYCLLNAVMSLFCVGAVQWAQILARKGKLYSFKLISRNLTRIPWVCSSCDVQCQWIDTQTQNIESGNMGCHNTLQFPAYESGFTTEISVILPTFFLSPLRLVIVFHKWSSVEKSLIANQCLVSFQLGCIWRNQRARRSGRHCNWWHNCQRPTLSTTWVMWLWEWLVRVSEWFD